MRVLYLVLLLFPVYSFAQKLKVNEYDKFIKQRIIEFEPLPIHLINKANISLIFSAVSSTLHVSFKGYGWGVAAINENQETIFLFSNDSTVTVRSVGLQSYEFGATQNTYNHQYYINVPDIDALSRNDLVGIRKYTMKDYSDMKITKETAVKIKKLSGMFLEELKKAKVIHTLKQINVKDVANHIGDSVTFCSKVYGSRYFESSENKPTILDVNSSFTPTSLTTVIWDEDRKEFSNKPELLYNNKDVCISGVVRLVNNIPQITIRKREQVVVKSLISLDEIGLFIGDSVKVQGKVFSAKYFPESKTSPTLLNVGAAFPDQPLTVVIENKDRGNFIDSPESYYIDKEIQVIGRIVLFKDKPQVVIRFASQIFEVKFTASNTPPPVKVVINNSTTSSEVSKNAEFVGGSQGWSLFLNQNLKIPLELEPGQKRTVIVRFIIKADGVPHSFKIIQSAGKVFDKEVLRVMKMMPKWTPKYQNGIAMEEAISLPVTFTWVESNVQVNN